MYTIHYLAVTRYLDRKNPAFRNKSFATCTNGCNFALSTWPVKAIFINGKIMPLNKFKTFVLLVVMLVLFGGQATAQHKLWGSNLLLEGRVNYGFMINHHLEMKIFNAHFPSFEINLGKETYGRERWQAMYGYPFIGVSYWYSQMGNSQFLGSANAIFPYVNYPIIRNRKHELNFRVGLGLAYLTKRFDRLENYKYIAIGSHVNAAINLMAEYRWRFNPRMNFAAGLALMHFSNGSTKTPNYGINTPSINLAFAYRLSKENTYLSRKIMPSLYTFEFPGTKTIDFSIGATAAYKDMGSEYGRTFMIYNMFGTVMKQFSFKSAFGIGFDLTYNESDYYFADLDNVPYEKKSDLLRFGIAPTYQLIMSNLSYNFAVGYYIKGKMAPTTTYFKLGLQYQITKGLFANLTLRTHFGQADFVGIGLGYKIPWIYSQKL